MEESRREIKRRVSAMLKTAEVSPKAMTALFLVLSTVLSMIGRMVGDAWLLYLFFSLLTTLLKLVLDAGFYLYCMTIRRGERAGYLVLFDSFESALKIALQNIVISFLIILWFVLSLLASLTLIAMLSAAIPEASILFFPAGFLSLAVSLIVYYRYHFSLFNLLENPEIGILESIRMSRRQTIGWKKRLFILDLSYISWFILGSIPHMIYTSAISEQVQDKLDGVAYTADNFAEHLWNTFGTLDGAALGIPALVWMMIIAVWTLVVSMFWLPHYRCVLLEYFEAAKRASGIGEGAAPWEQEEFFQR